MSKAESLPVLDPHIQIDFFDKLQEIKEVYFYSVLQNTVKKVPVRKIDSDLAIFAPIEGLQKLANLSLRGEVLFPVPCLLRANPYLLGYYRLLLGFSQKEFYHKGPFGSYKAMEEKGRLTKQASTKIDALCMSLSQSSFLPT